MDAQEKSISKPSLWSRDFILITLASLFMSLAFQMLLPIMPVYAENLGGSTTAAGLVVGVFTFSAVIIRPITGRLLDLYGRKGVYLAGLVFFGLCVIAYHWTPGILILLILRFIHGFGWGAASTASSTIATDVTPKSRLGEGMGYFGLTSTLSMAIAPVLGLSILNRYGMGAVFNVSALSVLLCLAIALMIRYQKSEQTPQGNRGSIFEKSAIYPGLIILFLTMSYGAVISFIALYAGQQGINNIGPFFTVYAVALFISRPLFGRLSDQKGYSIAIIPGILAVSVALLILYFAHSLSGFCVAGFVYGLGFGAVQPALMAMAVRDVLPARRGAANGTFFVGFDIGIGVGAITWGAVAEITGYRMIYLLAVLPVVIAFLLYLGKDRLTGQKN
ncbi:MFS transporter [Desulfitobacterium chlororespirans]|uniref:Predicted arabinose efflux permease, MFS family n=1 Tax=Desulfitobacterium chlororespirans DSM 11544 TaxID=1121395 RepID=A0A1M7SL75_9FIRM|nr:MFS transporter [Desulfitobacterium chlororespirans]SHN59176.1 Predicted arabinose efflux permease, MFS family [Desulfitobacterium chlororespirans DSM 11544]